MANKPTVAKADREAVKWGCELDDGGSSFIFEIEEGHDMHLCGITFSTKRAAIQYAIDCAIDRRDGINHALRNLRKQMKECR